MHRTSRHNSSGGGPHDGDDGAVTIEYGIVVATIVLLLVTFGTDLVTAVAGFFAGIPALFPTP